MPKGYYIPFTKEQEQKIKDEFLIKPVKRLADELGTTYGRIMRFLKKNDLEIPKALIEQRKLDSRKKKGDIPFNKGKKQIEYMTPEAIERSRKTTFKKGHIPHNALNDWEEVERKKKGERPYIMIKVPGSKKLQFKHKWLWEKHTKQKVKKGYNVVFKDGDTQNICIENLECISNAELMQRNTYHNYPKDIAQVIQLKGAIKRQINKHKN